MSSSQSRYDADLHDNQIIAMYDTEAEANAAAQVLQASGFPASSMRVLAQGKVLNTLSHDKPSQPENQSIWSAMASLFVPHDERTTFDSVIARGHAMLVVTPDATMDRHHLIHLLEDTHPFDFDARREEFRTESEVLPETGYRSAAATTAGSPAAQDAEARYRDARRETPDGANRVRSYISDRPSERTIQSGAAEPEMPPRVPTPTNTPL